MTLTQERLEAGLEINIQDLSRDGIMERALCQAIHSQPCTDEELDSVQSWVRETLTAYGMLELFINGHLIVETGGATVKFRAGPPPPGASDIDDRDHFAGKQQPDLN